MRVGTPWTLTCALAALLLAGAGAPGHQLPVAVQDDALPWPTRTRASACSPSSGAEVKAEADHPDQPAVVVFGQVRGARGPQAVHVEREDPGTGA
jgi:hypothetical protein